MKRPLILLVNPWIHDFAAYDLWARPMGLLVLASVLRMHGWEPRLVDCLDTDHPEMGSAKVKRYAQGRFARTPIAKPEPLQEIPRTFSRYGVDPDIIERDLLAMPRPEVIMVTSLMTYWYPGVREAIRLLKRVFPDVPLLLGGIYASLMSHHARAFVGADHVLTGPGEAVLPRSLFRLTGKGNIPDRSNADIHCTPALDMMRTLRFLPLLTSRGCPFRCTYCASRILAPRYVRRPVEEVVREVETVRRNNEIRDIALYDDAFLVDAESHGLPILEQVSQRVPGMRWHTPNGLHASAINPRVAGAMKQAGFETIRIGLETTSNLFHSQTGGKTSRETFLSAVESLRSTGFSTEQIGVYLLVGLPGQSRAQIEDDIDLVLGSGAHPRLAEYSPIPGTQMWDHALRVARYPIDREPLFQNCTLLPAAEDEVNTDFLRTARKQIRARMESHRAEE